MAGLFDKAKEFLSSEQGEKVTDQVLDKAAEFASKRTGGKHDEQIRQARKAADDHLGRPGTDRK
jgi:MT0933-like antitoxin protein